jgi:predicted lipoprotein with Yx(FWY)xxD motif
MRRPKKVILALSFAIAAGGAGIAVAQSTHSAQTTATPAVQTDMAGTAGSATINVASATVAGQSGQSEQILVDAHGLPLYTYNLDTAKQSRVDVGLAQLWPPLVSNSPTENGANGKLGVISDSYGRQVEYNGHFLYTFVKDTPGQVTGQGVAGFSVATPNLSAQSVPAAAKPAPSAATQPSPYRY